MKKQPDVLRRLGVLALFPVELLSKFAINDKLLELNLFFTKETRNGTTNTDFIFQLFYSSLSQENKR